MGATLELIDGSDGTRTHNKRFSLGRSLIQTAALPLSYAPIPVNIHNGLRRCKRTSEIRFRVEVYQAKCFQKLKGGSNTLSPHYRIALNVVFAEDGGVGGELTYR